MRIIPTLNYSQSLKLGFKNYAKFSGRSRRSEFFYFYFTFHIILFILSYIYPIKCANECSSIFNGINKKYLIYFLIPYIVALPFLLPMISLMVRRLHDIGKSGAYSLLYVIPLCTIILICFWSYDSEQRTNKYGPSPKYIINEESLLPENNDDEDLPPPNPQIENEIVPVTSNMEKYPNDSQAIPKENPIENENAPNPEENSFPFQEAASYYSLNEDSNCNRKPK